MNLLTLSIFLSPTLEIRPTALLLFNSTSSLETLFTTLSVFFLMKLERVLGSLLFFNSTSRLVTLFTTLSIFFLMKLERVLCSLLFFSSTSCRGWLFPASKSRDRIEGTRTLKSFPFSLRFGLDAARVSIRDFNGLGRQPFSVSQTLRDEGERLNWLWFLWTLAKWVVCAFWTALLEPTLGGVLWIWGAAKLCE